MDDKQPEPSGALSVLSILLGLAGVIAVGWAVFMPTMTEPHFDYSESQMVEAVYNLGLLRDQAMIFQGGLAAIIVATVLWGVDRLSR